MNRRSLAVAVFSLGALAQAGPRAQTVSPDPMGRANACASPAFHRLDFRVGTFDAKTSSGIQAGHDRAESILLGCGIVEDWTGAVSGHGHSLTVFDERGGRWRMLFVNDTGNILRLAGTFHGDALVLTGENYSFDGRYGLHRMAWSPLPSGGFRQLWEFSTDRGRTWREIFDGRFTRLE